LPCGGKATAFPPGQEKLISGLFSWGMGTFLPEDADAKQRLDILQIIELFGRTQGLIRSLPGGRRLCQRNRFEEFVGLPVLGEVTHFVVREVGSGLKTQSKAGPPQAGSWVHLEMALGQHSWECWHAFRGLLEREVLVGIGWVSARRVKKRKRSERIPAAASRHRQEEAVRFSGVKKFGPARRPEKQFLIRPGRAYFVL
jgi:hypothetical protein